MSDTKVTTGTIVADTETPAEVVNQEVTETVENTENLEAAPKEEEEEKKPEAPVQTEEEKRFAAKFAALTRKEKAIRESEKRLNARIKELEDRLAASAPKTETVQEEPFERRLRKDPFKTLDSAGLNYDTLTQIALNNGKLTPELQMQLMKEEIEQKHAAELAEIKKQIQAREEREKAEADAKVINDFKNGIAQQIKAAADQYELLAAEGQDGIETVFDIIDRHYQETGEVLDVQETLGAVEEELLEQAKKRIGLAKIKKLMGASEQKTQEVKPQPVKKTGTTLSNNVSQVQPTSGQYLSDEESKREAAKLIRFDS